MEKQPIYCFKLDKETFELTRLDITDYEIVKCNNYGRYIYKWETPKINRCEKRFYLDPDKLDRFTCYKVFTFNPDVERVWNIIESTLDEQIKVCQAKLEKTYDILEQVKAKHSSLGR